MTIPMTLNEIRPIRWLHAERCLELIDQRLLPGEERWRRCESLAVVAEAIEDMTVRGAPAIGITAAYGVVLGLSALAQEGRLLDAEARGAIFDQLFQTRPTAVNLAWALDRMRALTEGLLAATGALDVPSFVAALEAEADLILADDIAINGRIGDHGAGFIEDGMGVLTHCNAGALATGGDGTALAVVRAAHRSGALARVYCTETRPWLQGARLTAWELGREGIERCLLVDSAAAGLLLAGEVDLVILGADRVTLNGDVANKVGTLALALAARAAGVPFYVAIPLSTLDRRTATGASIRIEERGADEVRMLAGVQIAQPETPVYNPVFDVTPADLVTAFVTDAGVLRPPYGDWPG